MSIYRKGANRDDLISIDVPDLRVETFVLVSGVGFGDPGAGSRILGDRRFVLLSAEFRAVIVDIQNDDPNDARSSQRRGTCKTGSLIVDRSIYDCTNVFG